VDLNDESIVAEKHGQFLDAAIAAMVEQLRLSFLRTFNLPLMLSSLVGLHFWHPSE
jgi:hypothetical protein